MNAAQSPETPNFFAHRYGPGRSGDEGYGRCVRCDARENTDESIQTCPGPRPFLTAECTIKECDRCTDRACQCDCHD